MPGVIARKKHVLEEDKSTGLWRDIGRIGFLLTALAILNTLYVFTVAPDSFPNWINTLLSTLFSVFSALVIGLLLFNHQARETGRTRKAELSRLLITELSEVKHVIEESRTSVPDEALEIFSSYKMKVSLHYTHPLIVEEAARSGLFKEEQATEMLRLARNMRAHNIRVQEAMTAENRAYQLRYQIERSHNFCPSISAERRYAEVGRSVQKSEDRIIEGCARLLESLGV